MSKTAARIAAEQSLLDARYSLGQSMGLSHLQINQFEAADTMTLPAADYSGLVSRRIGLVDLAMSRRADLAAARLREQTASTLSQAAQANLKPQLNLTVNTGYTGLAQGGSAGAFGGLTQNRGGANISANIAYQWPMDNNSARGQYLQQAASYDQSTIQVTALERGIGISVESALLNLIHKADQLKNSEDTIKLYLISLKNEKTKYKLGTTTLLDVLTVNDQLLNARLSNIAYKLNALNSLVSLNFATGTLLNGDHADQSIQLEQLVGIPKPDQEKQDHGR